MDPSIRRTLIVLVLLVALIFGVVVGRQLIAPETAEPEPAPLLTHLNTYVYEEPRPLADFELKNEEGEAATPEDLQGRWTFAFLGYTNCPDVCPATMAMLRRTDKLIPDVLPQPDYLLISADPERDTPEKMKEYLNFFGDDFHGLTGDVKEVRALAKSLNAVFVERVLEDGMVMVDHSAHLALLDPRGRMIAVLQPPHEPESIAEAFERIYQWAKSREMTAPQTGG
ncbi:SCO family protein [Marinobacter sp.]|uniref:SCO family protein n=1 Tax=Marinobacter sp. TaxID=50741 RepID=UPI00384F97CC